MYHQIVDLACRRPQKSMNVGVWTLFLMLSMEVQKIRALTIVDDFTRESFAIEVGTSMRGVDVVRVLERLKLFRGKPGAIRCDNGPEFVSKVLDKWAYENSVTLDFTKPGKPTDNAYIESFNGSFRDECLNSHWFESLEDAKLKISDWRWEYNEYRPHYSLGFKTPMEFANEATIEIPEMKEKTESLV